MTARYSTGMINYLAKQGSIDGALRNGLIEIYTGAQPASADAAATGTLLCRITNNSQGIVNEVQATGSVTLTGGSAGAVNSLTINGVDCLGASVPFNGTLAQTAADVAAQINRYKSSPDYTAIASSNVVTIYAGLGVAAGANGFSIVPVTTGSITTSAAAMANGSAPSNGLLFDNSVAGVLTKLSTQTWSGLNIAGGVAGWFRQHGAVLDNNTLDSAGQLLRIDGAIATSGAEMNLNSTQFAQGATTTLPTWQMTVPAQ
jgi:hypothetical protein